MTSDRLAQARAEAEQQYPGGSRRFTQANLQAAFQQGWLAADANPKPHIITQEQRRVAVWRAMEEYGISKEGASWFVPLLDASLAALGIKIEEMEEGT